jgi:hypothetical protein
LSVEDLLVRRQQTSDVVAAKGGERSIKGRDLSAISARQAKQIPIPLGQNIHAARL